MKIRFRHFASSFFLFLAINSFCQDSKTPKSLLWEVSGKGLGKPSFLYGTIHVICPEDLRISESTIKSFNQTEQLFLELDMDDPELATEMQKSMTGGTHLRYLMKEKNYKQVSTFFKEKVGYSIDLLGMIKPFYLLSFTYSPMIGCSQPVSVEGNLTKLAQERKIPIEGLETLQDQISIFDKISEKEQAEMLYNNIKDFGKMQEAFQEMFREYQSQDLDALMKISSSTNNHTSKYEPLLLDNRNIKWLGVINETIEKKPTFFAVGAAHLAGENGLINLLRKQGYTLKPVF